MKNRRFQSLILAAILLRGPSALAQKQYYLGEVSGTEHFEQVRTDEDTKGYARIDNRSSSRMTGDTFSEEAFLQRIRNQPAVAGFLATRTYWLPPWILDYRADTQQLSSNTTYNIYNWPTTVTKTKLTLDVEYRATFIYVNPPPANGRQLLTPIEAASLEIYDRKLTGEPTLIYTSTPQSDVFAFSEAFRKGRFGLDNASKSQAWKAIENYRTHYGIRKADLNLQVSVAFKTPNGVRKVPVEGLDILTTGHDLQSALGYRGWKYVLNRLRFGRGGCPGAFEGPTAE